jgi:hypothetical protein
MMPEAQGGGAKLTVEGAQPCVASLPQGGLSQSGPEPRRTAPQWDANGCADVRDVSPLRKRFLSLPMVKTGRHQGDGAILQKGFEREKEGD